MAKRAFKPTSFESLLAKPPPPAAPGEATASATRASCAPPSGQRSFAFAKPLSQDLLESYLRWCPAELSSSLLSGGAQHAITGSLTLRMKMLSGLGTLWDLAGRSGFFALELATIEVDTSEQYLIGAAITSDDDTPTGEVDLGLLWRLFQPFYAPQYDATPPGATAVPDAIRLALDSTISRATQMATSAIAERIVSMRRAELTSDLEKLCERRDHIDSRRRDSRPLSYRDPQEWMHLRRISQEIEARVSELDESLATLEAPLTSHTRRPLCFINWHVLRPS